MLPLIKNKIFGRFIICQILLAWFCPVFASSLSIPNITITGGKTANLNISKSEGEPETYYGFQFTIKCPVGIQVTDLKLNEQLKEAGFILDFESQLPAQNITLIAFSGNSNVNSSLLDNLVEVTLLAADDIPNNVQRTLTFSDIYFSKEDGSAVSFVNQTHSITCLNPNYGKNTQLMFTDFEMQGGESIEVSLQKSDGLPLTYRGFQFTVKCPEGIQITGVKLNSLNDAGFVLATQPSDLSVPVSVLTLMVYGDDVSKEKTDLIDFTFVADSSLGIGDTKTIKIFESSLSLDDGSSVDLSDSECTVTLTGSPIILPDKIILSAENLTLLVGQTYQLTAEVKPENVTDSEISWSSDNNTFAQVSEEGKITALVKGTVNITAKCGDVTAVCKVTILDSSDVTPKPGDGTTLGDSKKNDEENTEKGGSLIGSDLILRVGQTGEIVLGLPSGLSETPKLEWKLAEDGDDIVRIAVNLDGLSAKFTGLVKGTTQYSVVLAEKPEVVLANGNIKVIKIEPVSLTLTSVSLEGNSGKTELKATESLVLTAKVTPSDAQYSKILWSTDQPELLSFIEVDNEKGLEVKMEIKEKAKSEKVTISATVEDYPSISASYEISISDLLLGDANDDKGVTVTDVMVIAGKILNLNNGTSANPVESFCFINADVYPDKEIKVDDQDATLCIVRGIPYSAQSLTRSSSVYTSYLFWNITDENVIGLHFDNPMQFINLQVDITIPSGFEVDEVIAGSQFNGHILGYNMIEENVLRILVYSLERNEFKNNSGNLVEVRLKGSGNTEEFSFSNIISTDKSSNRYELQARNYPVSTGVTNMTTEDISVKVVSGGIEIYYAQGMILTVVRPNGQLLCQQVVESDNEIMKLSAGIYFISVGNFSKKILVK